MHMLKSFEDIFNTRAQPWVSHEHVFHEVDEVDVVVDPF